MLEVTNCNVGGNSRPLTFCHRSLCYDQFRRSCRILGFDGQLDSWQAGWVGVS